MATKKTTTKKAKPGIRMTKGSGYKISPSWEAERVQGNSHRHDKFGQIPISYIQRSQIATLG